MTAQNPLCGELSWKKKWWLHASMDNTTIGRPRICTLWRGVVSCVCGMTFLCGSTLVKVPLLQAGTVAIWHKLFKNYVLPQQTNTWSGWLVAIKDDWGMLGRALAKVEPHPATREKLLTKSVSTNQSAGNPKTFPIDEKVTRMHNQPRWASTLLVSFLSFFHAPLPDWTYLSIWYEHEHKSFLYPNAPNFTRHKFLDLSFYFFKEYEINVNIPNFCPPVF